MDLDSHTVVNFDDLLAYLMSYRHDDFYARLLSKLPKLAWDGIKTPLGSAFTMGLVWRDQRYHIAYSPTWVTKRLNAGKVGLQELQATLAHEGQHLLLKHIPRQMRLHASLYDTKYQRIFSRMSNLLLDAAANEPLQRVLTNMQEDPAAWVFISDFGIPVDISYEWLMYYLLHPEAPLHTAHGGTGGQRKDALAELGRKLQQQENQLEQLQQIVAAWAQNHAGGHAFWDDQIENLSQEEFEIAVQLASKQAEDVVRQTVADHRRGHGRLPAALRKQLAHYLHAPTVPWEQLFNNMLSTHVRSTKRRSGRRVHKKRYMTGASPLPGRIKTREYKILVAHDQSMSMHNRDVHRGLLEMQNMQRVNPNLVLEYVPFDVTLGKSRILRNKDRVEFERTKSGGTNFDPVFKRAKELAAKRDINLLVVFTDGYACPPRMDYRPAGIPLIWCLTANGQHPSPGYGKSIVMKDHTIQE